MKSDMDNREWLDDFIALKQVSKTNPFTVPEGYFHELAQHITTRIRLEGLKNYPSAGYTIPENYFDELSSNIRSRINIERALSAGDSGFTVPENYFDELSSNIQSRIVVDEAMNAGEGFTVPENYFDELSSNIQGRIAVEEAMNLADEGFTVPENYFDELSSNIQSRIAVEEAMGNEEGFTVPENYFEELSANIQSRIAVEEAINAGHEGFVVPIDYFDQLNQRILDKTVNADVEEEQEIDNVISINKAKPVQKKGIVRRLWLSPTIRYATAACFALILGVGVIFRGDIQAPDHNHSYLHEQVSSVPVDEIKSYLQLHMDASDTRTLIDANQKSNTSNADEDLSDYIDN
ncbi:hypothetical protein FHW88_000287 [Mucilaginibacter sp. SG538B]|uniref:hypothetical protein n=1 Tax=Mucilaginibacter sp. SG538B TaxID=2587021 RepID=UPI00159D6DE2|nr:hypothetical protein [Mucilaginibacter sp. SG538B]NVM62011.1 hypothetical protein [Mucilaginibacter sp. SG538B]